jgi:ribonuclease J
VLGAEGFITCFVVVDSVEGKVTAGPEIHARGFIEDDTAFDPVLPKIKQAVEDALRDGLADEYALAQVVRRTLGRWVNDQHRRRPMIVPVVVEA